MTLSDVQLVSELPESWEDPIFTRDQAELMVGQPGIILLTLPGAHLLAAVIRGAPADILTIYTAPQSRCQGLAGLLLEALFAQARSRFCHQVALEVRAGNAAAIALYQRHGFAQIGTRRAYYRNPDEDALVYQKNL